MIKRSDKSSSIVLPINELKDCLDSSLDILELYDDYLIGIISDLDIFQESILIVYNRLDKRYSDPNYLWRVIIKMVSLSLNEEVIKILNACEK